VACSIPIYYLIHRTMADGSEGLLMAMELPSALHEIACAEESGAWWAQRITRGRDTVFEGESLRRAVTQAAPRRAA
jgi:hypothetical protein